MLIQPWVLPVLCDLGYCDQQTLEKCQHREALLQIDADHRCGPQCQL